MIRFWGGMRFTVKVTAGLKVVCHITPKVPYQTLPNLDKVLLRKSSSAPYILSVWGQKAQLNLKNPCL